MDPYVEQLKSIRSVKEALQMAVGAEKAIMAASEANRLKQESDRERDQIKVEIINCQKELVRVHTEIEAAKAVLAVERTKLDNARAALA
jgi:hypothetical protein